MRRIQTVIMTIMILYEKREFCVTISCLRIIKLETAAIERTGMVMMRNHFPVLAPVGMRHFVQNNMVLLVNIFNGCNGAEILILVITETGIMLHFGAVKLEHIIHLKVKVGRRLVDGSQIVKIVVLIDIEQLNIVPAMKQIVKDYRPNLGTSGYIDGVLVVR